MKPKRLQNLTPKQISEYEEMNREFIEEGTPIRWNLPLMKSNQKPNSTLLRTDELKRPNPPKPEAIERAKFIDKTYRWNGR